MLACAAMKAAIPNFFDDVMKSTVSMVSMVSKPIFASVAPVAADTAVQFLQE